MNKIIFRADGNTRIGLGHIMRCLALADMLGDEFNRRFALVQPPQEVQTLIRSKGLTVVSLPTHDADKLMGVISPTEIVVLDGYSFNESFQRTIREAARRLIFIDDLLLGHQVADVIINHTGGIMATDYEAEAYTSFYLGSHYALLRPEFLRPKGFGLPLTDGPIFVSLGGTDLQNYSLAVIKVIAQFDSTLPVRLVLGPFQPNRTAIEQIKNQLPNLTILQNLDAGQMVAELTQCRLAITACSTVAYEVCAVNRPLISIVTASNQDRLAQFLVHEQLALSVHFPDLLNRMIPAMSLDTVLNIALQSFQFMPNTVADTLSNQRRLFDGRSPERLQALFNNLC